MRFLVRFLENCRFISGKGERSEADVNYWNSFSADEKLQQDSQVRVSFPLPHPRSFPCLSLLPQLNLDDVTSGSCIHSTGDSGTGTMPIFYVGVCQVHHGCG